MSHKSTKARRNHEIVNREEVKIENTNRAREQSKKSKKRAVRRNRKYIEEYKLRHPCPCGETESCCLSFHHLEGGLKEANISDMVNKGYGIARIKGEIEKCIILCLNCHAKLHSKEKKELELRIIEKERQHNGD